MSSSRKKSATITVEGVCIPLCYRMFEHTEDGVSHYGVSVENERTGEFSHVEDVTTQKQQAEQLLDLLAQGQVTAVSLKEIVEDFVAG